MISKFRPVLFFILILFILVCACEKKPIPPPPEKTPDPEQEMTSSEDIGPKPFVEKDGFRALAFMINGGLVLSLKNSLPSDEPYAENLSAQMIKALFWDLDHMRDLRKGDMARIVYKPTRDRFKVRLYGVEYFSTKFSSLYRYIFFWESDTKFPEYFTEAGEAVAKRMKNCPLQEYQEVISIFRPDNKSRKGIKFRVKTGTEIMMPYPAVVEKMNWDIENLGLSVQVNYPGTGVHAQFLHLSAIAADVEVGSAVTVGSVFARTGVSGKTQTPHLDYRQFKESEKGDQYVDPFELHGFETHHLAHDDYKDFVSVKHQILAKMDMVGLPGEKTKNEQAGPQLPEDSSR